ncbi:hypothetical protein G3545_01030 [Starkeya sp. ORNL1]|uniref:hypothetical protein n=1 Tax=Starkeya sp. ORNL1 TaxID=2709380 RepID=UPI0014636E14|nr:hypothetical protein [Starkeya sp. ORNL1]QJP12368.1 hypothetical protein G3545_01030 [Starkeya sp. ORNL1]
MRRFLTFEQCPQADIQRTVTPGPTIVLLLSMVFIAAFVAAARRTARIEARLGEHPGG